MIFRIQCKSILFGSVSRRMSGSPLVEQSQDISIAANAQGLQQSSHAPTALSASPTRAPNRSRGAQRQLHGTQHILIHTHVDARVQSGDPSVFLSKASRHSQWDLEPASARIQSQGPRRGCAVNIASGLLPTGPSRKPAAAGPLGQAPHTSPFAHRTATPATSASFMRPTPSHTCA